MKALPHAIERELQSQSKYSVHFLISKYLDARPKRDKHLTVFICDEITEITYNYTYFTTKRTHFFDLYF